MYIGVCYNVYMYKGVCPALFVLVERVCLWFVCFRRKGVSAVCALCFVWRRGVCVYVYIYVCERVVAQADCLSHGLGLIGVALRMNNFL